MERLNWLGYYGKRFEYVNIFRTRPDLFLEQHVPGYKSLIREFPVGVYLDSIADFKSRPLPNLLDLYDFVRWERTGKKIRGNGLVYRIKWYKFKRRFRGV